MDESARARVEQVQRMIEEALEDSGLFEDRPPTQADYEAWALSAARLVFHDAVADPGRDIAVHDVLMDPWTEVLYAKAHVALRPGARYVVIDIKGPEDL